jgi:hypothetical protein
MISLDIPYELRFSHSDKIINEGYFILSGMETWNEITNILQQQQQQ